MIIEENVIVLDIDGTICCAKKDSEKYTDIKPKIEVVNKIKDLKSKGFYVILFTSRQMRTYNGNIGKINANTAKTLFEWLEKHDIPYDEIFFGKPWCGKNGFYVDDRAIRPREFIEFTNKEIENIIERDSWNEVG